jgi:hypothetical protein
MHKTISSPQEAQQDIADRASSLMGLFFLMRCFGLEYLPDKQNMVNISEGIRSIGELGTEISDGLFAHLDTFELQSATGLEGENQ